ncbi:hypothetical protein HanPI659440_Chr05g0198961 [Helianthus annuus]|nr:hypothetical protein HanPI659440_Chr05g0198961 [Helianthus annuus]
MNLVLGVGSTIGAVVCILVGTLAREHSGPALAFSFLIAGIAAALSAFCYAELASRCPSAGSVYHYSYICGISPNLALLFGGPDSLPPFLARYTVLALGMAVDPCAAILVFVVTALLCVGIKEVVIIVRLHLFTTVMKCCDLVELCVQGLQSYERSRYFLFMDHISLFNKINYFYKDGYLVNYISNS